MVSTKEANKCWKKYDSDLSNYWGRLETAAKNKGLSVPRPTTKFDSTTLKGSCILGGDEAILHVPMNTSEDIKLLFEKCKKSAVVIGLPPHTAILGVQNFEVVDTQKNQTVLKTTSYKYTIIYCSENNDWSASSAFRIESETSEGKNSWLLNHPIHHIQPGNSKKLRIKAPEPYSLIGFIDWAIRALNEDVWSNLYPNLYKHLTDENGDFSFLINSKSKDIQPISEQAYERLTKTLSQGSLNKSPWLSAIKLWYKDTHNWGIYEKEITDLFRQKSLFS